MKNVSLEPFCSLSRKKQHPLGGTTVQPGEENGREKGGRESPGFTSLGRKGHGGAAAATETLSSTAAQGSFHIRAPKPLLALLLKKARTLPMSLTHTDKKAGRNREREQGGGYPGLRAHRG